MIVSLAVTCVVLATPPPLNPDELAALDAPSTYNLAEEGSTNSFTAVVEVVDDTTGRPLPGVGLGWAGSFHIPTDTPGESDHGDTFLIGARADEYGRFTLIGSVPEKGGSSYTVEARDQYWISIAKVQFSVSSANPPISSEPAQFVLRLSPGGVITGRVFDQNTRHGIAGVEMCLRSQPQCRALTGAQGRYRLEGLNSLQGELTTSVPEGYARPIDTRIRYVEPHPGKEMAGFDFSFVRALHVSGRVVDPQSRPVAGARVRGPLNELETGSDGTFSLGGFLPNWAAPPIEAEKDGYAQESFASLELADRDLKDIQIVLRPEARIVGVVLDQEDHPMKWASVYPIDGPTKGLLPAWSDATGRFEVTKLLPGKYRLIVNAPRLPVGSLENGYEAATVEVAEAKTVENVRLVYAGKTLFDISGAVVTKSGKRVAGARVVANEVGSGQQGLHAETVADQEGVFVLKDLPPGPYSVRTIQRDQTMTDPVMLEAGSSNNTVFVDDTPGGTE